MSVATFALNVFENYVAALAARLSSQSDRLYTHRAVNRLAHIVDGERGYADCCQRLHLDARFARGASGSGDVYRAGVGIEVEFYGDLVDGQRVAQWDKLGCVLSAHDARDPRDAKHVALVECVVAYQGEGFGLHDHATPRNGLTLRVRLVANVHHLRLAAPVNVGELGFCTIGQESHLACQGIFKVGGDQILLDAE